MGDRGKLSRRLSSAGSAWRISPIAPKRTIRIESAFMASASQLIVHSPEVEEAAGDESIIAR